MKCKSQPVITADTPMLFAFPRTSPMAQAVFFKHTPGKFLSPISFNQHKSIARPKRERPDKNPGWTRYYRFFNREPLGYGHFSAHALLEANNVGLFSFFLFLCGTLKL